jgi:hypothetical protein
MLALAARRSQKSHFSRDVAKLVTQPLWPSRVPRWMSCSAMMGGRDCQVNCAKAVIAAQSCYSEFGSSRKFHDAACPRGSPNFLLRHFPALVRSFGEPGHVTGSSDFEFGKSIITVPLRKHGGVAIPYGFKVLSNTINVCGI